VYSNRVKNPNQFNLAAHCFWQERLTNRILLNDGTYKVGVGKYNSDITIKDNEFTQIIDVSNTQLIQINTNFTRFDSLNFLLKII